MNEEKLVPKRRFDGYIDIWKQLNLSDVTSRIGDGLHGTPKYKENGDVFFINGNNLVSGKIIINMDTKRVSTLEQSKSDKELCENTILMSINGTIGNLAWYNNEKVMLGKSVAYIKINNCDKKFIYSFLQTYKVRKYYLDSLTGSTIKNLGLKAIRDTSLIIPSVLEQQKIGNFFKHLDQMISLEQRKLEKTKALKSAYLAEMFPAEGERVPKRRFAGFTEDWEEKKIGDLGSVAMNKRIFKAQTSTVGDVPFYKIGTFGSKPDAFISQELFEEYKTKYLFPEFGDILISASGSIGRTVEYLGKDEYFQDSNIVWLKHDERLNNLFLKQFYKIVSWEGLEGSTIKRLYNKNILETRINIPSLKEQQKIGRFFEKLDVTINIQQKKLEKLKATKQAYLEEMFV